MEPVFQIDLHKRDEKLLRLIREFFGGVGTFNNANDCFSFRVHSLNSIIAKVVPHFDNYPLRTQKQADYLL